MKFSVGGDMEPKEQSRKVFTEEELTRELDRLLQEQANNQQIKDWVEVCLWASLFETVCMTGIMVLFYSTKKHPSVPHMFQVSFLPFSLLSFAQANLDEVQANSIHFVRALMTSVCQSAIICKHVWLSNHMSWSLHPPPPHSCSLGAFCFTSKIEFLSHWPSTFQTPLQVGEIDKRIVGSITLEEVEPWVCSPFLRHLVFGVKDNAPSVVHLLVCLQCILLYWNILLFLMVRFYVPSLSWTLCRFRWQAVQGGRAADHAEGQPVAGLPVWRTEGASGPARPAGSDGGHGAVKQWVNSYLPMWKMLGFLARHRSVSLVVPVTVLK